MVEVELSCMLDTGRSAGVEDYMKTLKNQPKFGLNASCWQR